MVARQGASAIFDSVDSNEEAETKKAPAILVEQPQSDEGATKPRELKSFFAKSEAEVTSNKSGFDPKRQEIFFERSRQFEVPKADEIPISLFE